MYSPLRVSIPREIFDYQQAMSALAGYRSPRVHLAALVRKGAVVRVRKGLYVFGEKWRRGPVSKELLANLIYGPSYLSLEFALWHHGLIPERVEVFTSVTTGRSRHFDTPFGRFSYRQIPTQAFGAGFQRVEQEGGDSFLLAVPEKAVADKVASDRQGPLRSRRAMLTYLLENQRMEESGLRELSWTLLREFADRYNSRKIKVLTDTIRHLSREEERA